MHSSIPVALFRRDHISRPILTVFCKPLDVNDDLGIRSFRRLWQALPGRGDTRQVAQHPDRLESRLVVSVMVLDHQLASTAAWL